MRAKKVSSGPIAGSEKGTELPSLLYLDILHALVRVTPRRCGLLVVRRRTTSCSSTPSSARSSSSSFTSTHPRTRSSTSSKTHQRKRFGCVAQYLSAKHRIYGRMVCMSCAVEKQVKTIIISFRVVRFSIRSRK